MPRPIYSDYFYDSLKVDQPHLVEVERESLVAASATSSNSNDDDDDDYEDAQSGGGKHADRGAGNGFDEDEEGDEELIEESFLSSNSPRAIVQLRRSTYPSHLSPIALDLLCVVPVDVFVGATRYEERLIDNKLTISVYRDSRLIGTVEGQFVSNTSSRPSAAAVATTTTSSSPSSTSTTALSPFSASFVAGRPRRIPIAVVPVGRRGRAGEDEYDEEALRMFNAMGVSVSEYRHTRRAMFDSQLQERANLDAAIQRARTAATTAAAAATAASAEAAEATAAAAEVTRAAAIYRARTAATRPAAAADRSSRVAVGHSSVAAVEEEEKDEDDVGGSLLRLPLPIRSSAHDAIRIASASFSATTTTTPMPGDHTVAP